MRKAGWPILMIALGLLLVAVFVFLPSGAGPGALDSEISFITAMRGSLVQLNRAKSDWVEHTHKSEEAVPTMEDLAPYLGHWTNTIGRFAALGIEYKINPVSDSGLPSDSATLTRNICFRSGYCRFYPAGTRYGPEGSFYAPELSCGSRLLASYHNNRGWLAGALLILAIGSLVVYLIRRVRHPRQASGVCA
jgi:hypothetical protein